jgi:tetrahydromethanopterin S-methyltransferase subunit A
VCTLSSSELVDELAETIGVAIAGRLYTANLGIERLVRNVVANSAIRILVLCGRDPVLFRPGQTLSALIQSGVDADQRVIGAAGYLPILSGLSIGELAAFRDQISIVDLTSTADPHALRLAIAALPYREPLAQRMAASKPIERFVTLPAGGQRRPFAADQAGYFVIDVDEFSKQIIVRHYANAGQPRHQISDCRASRIMAAIVEAQLVSDLNHAGYLGRELAKAEIALRLGRHYEQDRPLHRATRTRRPNEA